MKRTEVYDIIESERLYQEEYVRKDPSRCDGQKRTVCDYLVLLDHYTRKAQDTWVERPGYENALDEVRKVAALAVACLESHGTSNLGRWQFGVVDPAFKKYRLFRDIGDPIE